MGNEQMSDWVGLLLFAVILAGFAIILYRLYLKFKRRTVELQALAERLGLSYAASDRDTAERLRFLEIFRFAESTNSVFHCMRGPFRGHNVSVFQHRYQEPAAEKREGNEGKTPQWLTVYVLEHEKSFPELRVFPEGRWAKTRKLVGYEDIDLESIEFSKAFVVKSKDKKFAYDVCHTRMMALLLEHPEVSLEIDKGALCITFLGELEVKEVEPRLGLLLKMRELLPGYLLKQ